MREEFHTPERKLKCKVRDRVWYCKVNGEYQLWKQCQKE